MRQWYSFVALVDTFSLLKYFVQWRIKNAISSVDTAQLAGTGGKMPVTHKWATAETMTQTTGTTEGLRVTVMSAEGMTPGGGEAGLKWMMTDMVRALGAAQVILARGATE